jgi:hypothetical protein
MLPNRTRIFKLPNRIRIFNKYVTNRLLRGFVNLSLGPFAIIRHVGRRKRMGQRWIGTATCWPLEAVAWSGIRGSMLSGNRSRLMPKQLCQRFLQLSGRSFEGLACRILCG